MTIRDTHRAMISRAVTSTGEPGVQHVGVALEACVLMSGLNVGMASIHTSINHAMIFVVNPHLGFYFSLPLRGDIKPAQLLRKDCVT